MSSCDRVLTAPTMSERRVRIGDSTTTRLSFDYRPQTVLEVEAQFSRETSALKEQQQAQQEAAYRNGYNDGATVARDEAAQQVERSAALCASLAEEFSRTRLEWFQSCEQQMLELIHRALESILGIRPSVAAPIMHAVRRSVALLSEGDRATVRCHPDDAEWVQESLNGKEEQWVGALRLDIVPDSTVTIGGCLVETEFGMIDARVEQQLRRLRGALQDAFASGTRDQDTTSTSPSDVSELDTAEISEPSEAG